MRAYAAPARDMAWRNPGCSASAVAKLQPTRTCPPSRAIQYQPGDVLRSSRTNSPVSTSMVIRLGRARPVFKRPRITDPARSVPAACRAAVRSSSGGRPSGMWDRAHHAGRTAIAISCARCRRTGSRPCAAIRIHRFAGDELGRRVSPRMSRRDARKLRHQVESSPRGNSKLSSGGERRQLRNIAKGHRRRRGDGAVGSRVAHGVERRPIVGRTAGLKTDDLGPSVAAVCSIRSIAASVFGAHAK
jgi:hypothetical protein